MQSPYEALAPRAILAAALLSSLGCASVPLMPAGVREVTGATWAGHYGALKQSMYFGAFYDDPSLALLDPRPFKELTHLTLPGNRPLPPLGSERGVIPAGTRVRIERVEMPSMGSLVGRPLLTPRYDGWVHLRVNRFDVQDVALFEDRTFVMVLPLGLTDAEQVERVLAPLLGEEVAVRAWLSRRRPEVREAIATKQAVAGMSYDELVASLGQPDRIDRTIEAGRRKDLCLFGKREVELVDDVVTRLP